MNLETTLLQMLAQSRETWQRLRAAIPGSGLDDQTKKVAQAIGAYYKEFPDTPSVERDSFLTYVLTVKLKNATKEQKDLWRHLVGRFSEEVNPAIAEGMYNRLLEVSMLAKIQTVLERWQEGDEIDASAEINTLVSDLKNQRSTTIDDSKEDANVLDLLDAQENQIGLKFSQKTWWNYIRPLQLGDFVGVCARPDAGKTSFLTCESANFADQMDELYGPESSIYWFCNEGVPRKIYLRHYCSIFKMNLTELGEFKRKKCKGSDTRFMDEYYKLTRGEDRFVVMNANNKTNTWVEDVLAQKKPSIVIYDMIDNIRFNGMTMHGGTRTDQVLESMYQWARVLAGTKEVQHVAFATSQISGDGEGIPYPSKAMLKDSKTGKQGTFDLQIMMGQSADPRMQSHRYFGTPKNKLTVDGAKSFMQQVSTFDHSRGLFVPMGEASPEMVEESEDKVKKAEDAQEADVAKPVHSRPKIVKPVAASNSKAAELEDLDV